MPSQKTAPKKNTRRPDCFIIMPIGAPDGYSTGHFERILEDLLIPACTKAGFTPVRADQVRQTNLIHLDVLKRLLESPMAICDLSSRNPNVLFELGLRQAFDKPVVLVREVGTPDIFDIAPLRYTEYRRERVFHEVVEDQGRIAAAVKATAVAHAGGDGVNSVVKLLGLDRAVGPRTPRSPTQRLLEVVRSEMAAFRDELRSKSLVILDQPASVTATRDGRSGRPDLDRLALSGFQAIVDEFAETKSAMLAGKPVTPEVLWQGLADFRIKLAKRRKNSDRVEPWLAEAGWILGELENKLRAVMDTPSRTATKAPRRRTKSKNPRT